MTSSFDSDADPQIKAVSVIHTAEEWLASVSLALMMLLPLAEIVVRPFVAGGIPGSIPFVEHLTLWVGFIGACVAARSGKLIALTTATFIPEGIFRTVARTFSATVGAMVSTLLAWAALDVVAIEMEFGREIALGIPSWMFQLVLPVAFGGIG
ncbi:MAG: TRAP transporter small permease, partial [Vicinamibacterales bacterium]